MKESSAAKPFVLTLLAIILMIGIFSAGLYAARYFNTAGNGQQQRQASGNQVQNNAGQQNDPRGREAEEYERMQEEMDQNLQELEEQQQDLMRQRMEELQQQQEYEERQREQVPSPLTDNPPEPYRFDRQ